MQERPGGRFITVEGGEGVGKSLFCELISSELTRLGVAHHRSREPGGTPLAENIRSLFCRSDDSEIMTPEAELFLISAARSQHCSEVIRPTLAKGTWILCDRFADSSRAYQGILGGLPTEKVESVIELSAPGLEPDLTFLLDCDISISAGRIRQRSPESHGTDRYDHATPGLHEKLRQAYLQLARRFPERFCVLDASGSPEDCAAAAVRILKERFSLAEK